MKKFFLFMGATLAAFAANAWTVNFTNPNNWPEVSIWAWDDDSEQKTNFTGDKWPGMPMTKEGDVWTYTGEGNPTKVIFNDNGNGSQTQDLDFVDNATYNLYGQVGAELKEYKVYFNNDAKWDKVFVYTFGPTYFGPWPGTEITKGEDGKTYVATITSVSVPTCGGIIFNNGSGGADNQTEDLVFEIDKTYTNVPPTTGEYTVYWDNFTCNWSSPHIYYYCRENGNEATIPMTKVTTEYDDVWDLWSYTLPVGVTNMLFCDGNDNDISGMFYSYKIKDKHVYSKSGDMGVYEGTVTAIEDIEIDISDAKRSDPDYYNLQGQPVKNPSNGIFIKVTNGKASKVFVK